MVIPMFPARPYVYVLYAYDHVIGDPAPPPKWNDTCPTPPGPGTDGCVVSARLSRLTANGNTMVPGSERVLIEGWCTQFQTHSIGDLAFGPDGALYVSGGEGAAAGPIDYGQFGGTYSGDMANPCGDPPSPAGTALQPPSAQGGALRSQSPRRPSTQPTVLSGAILRVDPDTGEALPDNPLASRTDANAKRIVAYGMRNPFRFTLRPGTSEIWVGDVGANTWEEINRIAAPTAGVTNFGWPCYEGAGRQPGYDAANTGDVPVTGDWNHDGVDTIGVFRAGAWNLRNSNSPGLPDLRISYGTTGDVPVVGDWNNDGRDTIGTFR